MFLTDLTPTILDYADVPQPGSTYEGRKIHPIMGKSIRPLLDGSTTEIHGVSFVKHRVQHLSEMPRMSKHIDLFQ